MPLDSGDILEQVERHLTAPCQSWLLGAGIGKDAGIPLVRPLTDRVRALTNGSSRTVLDALVADLPPTVHIEQILNHLGDYTALADRSREGAITLGSDQVTAEHLRGVHAEVVQHIVTTVRWGYVPSENGDRERVGDPNAPIVKVDGHSAFVDALFHAAQAGLLERRGPVRLFTTNYDTLLEDALALASIPYWDGFSGGAIAFRTYHFGDAEPGRDYRAHLVKLHGSIDWYLGDDERVWRVREGDTYPARKGRVLIHPQATKYLATQRDPFAAQFDLFRRALAQQNDNILAVCGYSFGDDHVNDEIELALTRPGNRTTLLAFVCETDSGLPHCIERWRRSSYGSRIYTVTQRGIYSGTDGPCRSPSDDSGDWWKFAGVTKLIRHGAKART